ncbi:hypothetical protein HOY82DRAFT_331284 [Tuber indicum]|nr:hypothetical protein HOY82DRAFT_331284 [Tuber indicum]
MILWYYMMILSCHARCIPPTVHSAAYRIRTPVRSAETTIGKVSLLGDMYQTLSFHPISSVCPSGYDTRPGCVPECCAGMVMRQLWLAVWIGELCGAISSFGFRAV